VRLPNIKEVGEMLYPTPLDVIPFGGVGTKAGRAGVKAVGGAVKEATEVGAKAPLNVLL